MTSEKQIVSIKRTYGCKVLLSGEYLVLDGAPSLAIPYLGYSARLTWDKLPLGEENWQAFSAFLEELSFIDTKSWKSDLEKGLSYVSDIPIGYGLGSSGALVAAVYDNYCFDKEQNTGKLKSELALMESFFHGKSSGLDPLVIYLDRAIIIGEDVRVTHIDKTALDGWALYDSGLARKTAPLVKHFQTSIKPRFKDELSLLNALNDQFIYEITRAENPGVKLETMQRISELQLKIYADIIDPKTREFWSIGLKNKSYFVKLCGAGGGGMYLVYGVDHKHPEGSIALNIS